jgi:hypothetical protein
MTAEELIEFLKTVPPKAYVVVGGEVMVSAELVKGRAHKDWRQHYYNKVFRPVPAGRDLAVYFLRHAELSTGEVGLLRA